MSTESAAGQVRARDRVRNVGDLMTGDLITILATESAAEASRIITSSGLHALPVVDVQGSAIGMVTSADLGGDDLDESIGSVMAGPLMTIELTASVSEAAALMRCEHIHHLIVTERGQTVGILSSYDLLFMLVD